jgi:hypothetical protein
VDCTDDWQPKNKRNANKQNNNSEKKNQIKVALAHPAASNGVFD